MPVSLVRRRECCLTTTSRTGIVAVWTSWNGTTRWRRWSPHTGPRRAAQGRVVFVTGEPGIGKTSLVGRFVRDLGDDARVLAGTCDDLSIPRPLGPIRDLAGEVSPTLGDALAGGATPHDVHDLLIAELEAEPHPTVLVLEDVHWADDATFDAITVLGRRIGALPALLVLTFRAGEAPPGHRLHSVIGTMRADHSVIVELAPLSEGAVASLAGDDADGRLRGDRRQPVLRHGDAGVALRRRAAARRSPTRSSAVHRAWTMRRAGWSSWCRSCRPAPAPSLLDAVMPGWTAAAIEPERRQLLQVESSHVRFRHELARHAIRSSVPAAALSPAARRDPRGAAGRRRRPGRHRPPRRGGRRRRRRRVLRAGRGAASGGDGSRTPRRTRTTCAPATSPTAGRRPSRRSCSRSWRWRPTWPAASTTAIPAIERAIAINDELGDVASVGRCKRILSRLHWYAGNGAAARRTGLEAVDAPGAAGRVGRAGAGLQRAVADGDAGRGRRRDAPVGPAGAGARRPARRRQRAGARAGQHRLGAHADGLRGRPHAAARGASPSPTAPATGTRGRGR